MILDLFAGPGGWEVGLSMLGIDDVVGIEWDAAACETRAAAGYRTIRADVAQYPTGLFVGKVAGLIASPPCQDFSMAGKRAGITGERGMLIHEVMRWARALEPEWVACEQVPPALPVWQLFAGELRSMGYKTWAGVVNAEEYGLPQTRKRAILMASRGALALPEPTHTRYRAHLPDGGRTPPPAGMFGRALLPWVSMAEALGWQTGVAVNTRGDRKTPGGNEFHADAPSWALTEKTRSWTLRNNSQENAAKRRLDEPAPTMFFGHRANEVIWQRRDSGPAAEREPRMLTQPSYTIRANGSGSNPAGVAWGTGGDAARVTVAQAAVLQSFPPDYPWRGSRTKQFEQIGNAVPPLLAAHVLAPLIGATVPVR